MPFRLHVRRWLSLLVVLACVIVLFWTIRSLGPRKVLEAALRADPLWLALSALPVGGRFLIWGWKWRRMLGRRERVPYGFTLRALAAGSFLNLTTPTAKLAGGLVRAAMLRRHRGWELTVAYGYAMADQVTNVLGHLLLYGVLASFGGARLPPGPLRTAFLASGALTLAAVAAAALLRPLGWRLVQWPAATRRLSRLIPARFRARNDGTIERSLARVFGPVLREGSLRRTFVPDLLWAAAAFSMLCLANAMVLRAMGVRAQPLAIALALVAGYFAGVLVGAWGGIGVTEAALTALYVQFGIAVEEAAAAALLHRAVFYLVVLGWGGWALAREGRRPSRDAP